MYGGKFHVLPKSVICFVNLMKSSLSDQIGDFPRIERCCKLGLIFPVFSLTSLKTLLIQHAEAKFI